MQSLDVALNEHASALTEVVKLGRELGRALKGWEQATADGNLADIRKLADLVVDLTARMTDPAAKAADSWTFDAKGYLNSSDWLAELEAKVAEVGGLRAFPGQAELICPPVAVRADANRSALKIGKKTWKKLRPSSVVAELKKIANASSGSNSQAFLETLYGVAISPQTKCGDDNNAGVVTAKLRDIYDVLALNAAWKKENSDLAFAQALYALHGSEVRLTKSQRKYQFEFPSGHPKPSDLFSVVADDGKTISYYMIHFI